MLRINFCILLPNFMCSQPHNECKFDVLAFVSHITVPQRNTSLYLSQTWPPVKEFPLWNHSTGYNKYGQRRIFCPVDRRAKSELDLSIRLKMIFRKTGTKNWQNAELPKQWDHTFNRQPSPRQLVRLIFRITAGHARLSLWCSNRRRNTFRRKRSQVETSWCV